MDYQGIKIADRVIVVERPVNDGGQPNQGYVVDLGNKKMLESAHSWGSWTRYDNSIEDWKEREAKSVKVSAIDHEYDNGHFGLELLESASWSSQGGKLSFWDCLLTGPDGTKFVIGINSELLLHLLKACRFDKGRCAEELWLGRVRGNQVGAFCESMPEFAQAKKDEAARSRKKTVDYREGDIVETLTSKELYVGEFWVYCKLYERSWSGDTVVACKPRKMHGFVNVAELSGEDKYNYCLELKETKPARVASGERDLAAAEKARRRVRDFPDEYKSIDLKSDEANWLARWDYELASFVRLDDSLTAKEAKEAYDECVRNTMKKTGGCIDKVALMESERTEAQKDSLEGCVRQPIKVYLSYADYAVKENQGW